ncbi:heme biosynthesis HemY N-terminal domain-containing protein, partial [Bartonella sp. MR168JLCBS]
MTRVLIYTFGVCMLGLAFGWVANHNDVLIITFLHFRFSISLLTLLSVLILFLGILVFLWWLLSVLFSLPGTLSNYFYKRGQKLGYEALSQGVLAAFAGDGVA